MHLSQHEGLSLAKRHLPVLTKLQQSGPQTSTGHTYGNYLDPFFSKLDHRRFGAIASDCSDPKLLRQNSIFEESIDHRTTLVAGGSKYRQYLRHLAQKEVLT